MSVCSNNHTHMPEPTNPAHFIIHLITNLPTFLISDRVPPTFDSPSIQNVANLYIYYPSLGEKVAKQSKTNSLPGSLHHRVQESLITAMPRTKRPFFRPKSKSARFVLR